MRYWCTARRRHFPPNKSKQKKNKKPDNSRPRFVPRSLPHRAWGNDGTVGCPDSVRLILRYGMMTTATTTVGALYSYQLRGNSAFDPDFTSTGAQPNYYDSWANMYNSYLVLSSRIMIEVMNLNATAPVLVGVYPAYNTALPAAISDLVGMRYARSVSVLGSGNAVKARLTSLMSTSQMFGIPEIAVPSDDLYSAIVTTNPAAAQTWYWTICAQDEAGSATLNLQLRIILEYDVKFFDPSVVNLSLRTATPAPSSGALAAAVASSATPQCSCCGHATKL